MSRAKASGTASAVETGIAAKPAGTERMPQQPVGSAHEGKPPAASGSHSSDMGSGKNTDADASALPPKAKAKGKKATGNGKGKADKQPKGDVPGKGSINVYKEVTAEAFIYGSHTYSTYAQVRIPFFVCLLFFVVQSFQTTCCPESNTSETPNDASINLFKIRAHFCLFTSCPFCLVM